jgi:signal transduction histidine kinase
MTVRYRLLIALRVALVVGTVTSWIFIGIGAGFRFIALLVVVAALVLVGAIHLRRRTLAAGPPQPAGWGGVPISYLLAPQPPVAAAVDAPAVAAFVASPDRLAPPMLQSVTPPTMAPPVPLPAAAAAAEDDCDADRPTEPEIRRLITSLHLAADDLLAQKMHSTVAVEDLAHQVRAHLQLLSLRLDRLSVHIDPSGSSAHDEARADVDRLNTILTDQMEFVRGTSGRVPTETDAVRVVRERVAAWSALSARHRSGPIGSTICESATILTQQGALGQVLDILLDNAIKYTPPAGAVHVTTQCDDGRFVVKVSDQGKGLTPSERAAAVTRGWRADPNGAPGCGLGLSIASVLVRTNRGRLSLADPPSGPGLEVTVEFPLIA